MAAGAASHCGVVMFELDEAARVSACAAPGDIQGLLVQTLTGDKAPGQAPPSSCFAMRTYTVSAERISTSTPAPTGRQRRSILQRACSALTACPKAQRGTTSEDSCSMCVARPPEHGMRGGHYVAYVQRSGVWFSYLRQPHSSPTHMAPRSSLNEVNM